jgi:hypothetical protein
MVHAFLSAVLTAKGSVNHGEYRSFVVHHPSTTKDRAMNKPSQTDDQDPVTDQVIIESSENENDQKGVAPAWLMSLGAHALAVTIMAAVVFSQGKEEIELPPGRINIVPDVAKEKPRDTPTALEPVDITIPVENQADETKPQSLVENPVEVDPSTDEAKDDGSPGEIQAVADVQTGSTGVFMAIGTAGGGAGMFSNRKGLGRIKATRSGPGTTCPEVRISSIDAALRWFKRHQSPNGMWDVDQYQNNCNDPAGKCEPGIDQPGNADIACTAYAIMCFLGAGYDHLSASKYRPTVESALKWLLDQQKADGLFGERNYEHAIATMALAEALGMSEDPRLRTPTQRAVDVVIARQAQDPSAKDKSYAGLGWDYVNPNASRNDTSVTGWNVMALKSAMGAGLQVGNSMMGAKNWLDRSWKAANPDWKRLDPYQGTSVFPYTYDASSEKVDKEHLSCVGALCAIYLGHHEGDVMLETMGNTIMKNDFPTSWPTNTYTLYYKTLAIFQMGEKRWKQWDEPVAKLLAKAQRTDDSCFNGSWDFAGTKFHGHDTGRLLSTAYACLSQEVIWRYIQVEHKK